MNLKNITLKNYRGFEYLEAELHERLTVIVGNNGAGKTSILEGIAISLGTLYIGLDSLTGISINKRDVHLKAYRMGESDDVQAQYPVEISAEGIADGREISWKRTLNGEGGSTTVREAKKLIDIARSFQEKIRAGDKNVILPIIAYYGTGRLWDYHREKKTDTFKENTKTNGYIDSLDGTANIKLMMNWFSKKTIQKLQKSELGLSQSNELTMVCQAMELCFERITGHKNVKLIYNLDTKEIECYYTDSTGLRMSIPLSQMSDGYKSTISLIADIAYRIAVLNPQLGMSGLTETDGVVLIDEVDLHLHPAWQHRILHDIQEIFPKVQFIVTTHAPAVISSVRSENLLILRDNQIIDANEEIYGNDVNSILNEIMGVSERNPAIANLFAKFSRLLGEGYFDEAENVLDEIDEKRNYHDKEVAADRVKLKLERIRRGKNDCRS